MSSRRPVKKPHKNRLHFSRQQSVHHAFVFDWRVVEPDADVTFCTTNRIALQIGTQR